MSSFSTQTFATLILGRNIVRSRARKAHVRSRFKVSIGDQQPSPVSCANKTPCDGLPKANGDANGCQ